MRSPAKTARSAVTNGTTPFLGGDVDGRAAPARRFRDVAHSIASDLGGSAHLSEAQTQLTKRAAALSVAAEQFEAKMAGGEEVDLEEYGRLVDRLGRVLSRLGIKRAPRDVGDDLDAFIAKATTGGGAA